MQMRHFEMLWRKRTPYVTASFTSFLDGQPALLLGYDLWNILLSMVNLLHFIYDFMYYFLL
jgi:hypothetical protein